MAMAHTDGLTTRNIGNGEAFIEDAATGALKGGVYYDDIAKLWVGEAYDAQDGFVVKSPSNAKCVSELRFHLAGAAMRKGDNTSAQSAKEVVMADTPYTSNFKDVRWQLSANFSPPHMRLVNKAIAALGYRNASQMMRRIAGDIADTPDISVRRVKANIDNRTPNVRSFSVTPEVHRAVNEAAEANGLTASSLLRAVAVKFAKDALRGAKDAPVAPAPTPTPAPSNAEKAKRGKRAASAVVGNHGLGRISKAEADIIRAMRAYRQEAA